MSSFIEKYKFKLDEIEYETLEVIKYYEFLRRQYENKSVVLFSRSKDPRENKFFNGFKKLVVLSKNKKDILPDVKLFIKAQFEVLKLINPEILVLPRYILGSDAWGRYKNYINQLCIEENCHSFKGIENKDYILQEIKRSNEIIETLNYNKYGEKTNLLYNLLKDKENWFYLSNKMISPYYLSVSKFFNSIVYKKIPLKIRKDLPENLDIYKSEIHKFPDLVENIKSILKDDFNE